MKDIHWFPGHMKKAKIEIENRVKLVDIVIEIVDARAPFSTRNPELLKITSQKPRLIVLSKIDLANPNETKAWEEYFKNLGYNVVSANLNVSSFIKDVEKMVEESAKEKRDREVRKGLKKQPVRAMIIGIPNVGKSTLINKLTKSKAAGVENRPGFTKSQQWIRVNKDFDLLDTPGVLPMSYDEKEVTINLALTGSIKDDILPIEDLATILLEYLKENYKGNIFKRYEVDENMKPLEILTAIAKNRGYFKGSEPNVELASKNLLGDFRKGLLGKCTLESPKNA